jgi:hypothetical protein
MNFRLCKAFATRREQVPPIASPEVDFQVEAEVVIEVRG